jgi:hypothetical protein
MRVYHQHGASVQSTLRQEACVQMLMIIRDIQLAKQGPTRIVHEQQTKCKFNEMGLKQ